MECANIRKKALLSTACQLQLFGDCTRLWEHVSVKGQRHKVCRLETILHITPRVHSCINCRRTSNLGPFSPLDALCLPGYVQVLSLCWWDAACRTVCTRVKQQDLLLHD